MAGTAGDGLWLAWTKYQEFEDCEPFDHSKSLGDYVYEWEDRLAGALAAGCRYTHPVLAFKLLKKINMEEVDIQQLFSCLGIGT